MLGQLLVTVNKMAAVMELWPRKILSRQGKASLTIVCCCETAFFFAYSILPPDSSAFICSASAVVG